jgi:hypothetical protein
VGKIVRLEEQLARCDPPAADNHAPPDPIDAAQFCGTIFELADVYDLKVSILRNNPDNRWFLQP